MTPQHSHSSHTRYLLAGAATFLICGLAVLCLSLVAIQRNWVEWHFSSLLKYQLTKLRTTPKIDILLAGDSTLGYSVDAAQWSKDLNRSVVSVALTGIYGYGGTLNMIRRAARDHAISTVVIMQTPQLPLRPQSYVGYLHTAPDLADVFKLPLAGIVKTAASAMSWNVVQLELVQRAFAAPGGAGEFATDYVQQGPPLSSKPEPAPKALSPEGIDPGNLEYIRQIAEFCRAQGLKCIYVHGTLTESTCRNSAPYFDRFAALTREAGLPVALPPTCMPWQDTGDEFDHLIPAKKAEYSRKYLDALRPLLTP